ncbi:hypothetical protein K8I61_20650 [bacterium]|nr:hypothetical protein [bacterium]
MPLSADLPDDRRLAELSAWLGRRWMPILALCLVGITAVFAPALNLRLYADDFHSWNTVAQTAHESVAELFLETYNPEFYRPFEFLLIRLNYQLIGRNPAFYHAAAILGHLLGSLAVLMLCLRLGFGRVAGTASAVFFGLHQTNAMAVLSADAASQVWSTTFGLLALCVLLPRDAAGYRHAAAAFFFLLLALFWKDSGVTFAMLALTLVALHLWRIDRRAAIACGLAVAAALALYLFMRHQAGVVPMVYGYRSRYELWLGANVPKNIGLMLLSLLSPVGSTIIVLRKASLPFAIATAVVIAVVASWLAVGVVRFARRDPRHRTSLAILFALMALSFFPDALATRVSELYTYKSAAFFAIFLGLGVLDIHDWGLARGRRAFTVLTAAMVALVLACHVLSIKHKEFLMRSNGEMAWHILRQIKQDVPELADGADAVLANARPGPAPLYSIFYMEGVNVLGGKHALEMIYETRINHYNIVEPETLNARCRAAKNDCLAILYDRGDIDARRFDASGVPET